AAALALVAGQWTVAARPSADKGSILVGRAPRSCDPDSFVAVYGVPWGSFRVSPRTSRRARGLVSKGEIGEWTRRGPLEIVADLGNPRDPVAGMEIPRPRERRRDGGLRAGPATAYSFRPRITPAGSEVRPGRREFACLPDLGHGGSSRGARPYCRRPRTV